MSDAKTTIRRLRGLVIDFRDERDWAQFHKIKDLVLGLGVEAAELSELLLWKDDEQIEKALEQPEFRKRLAEELADVQIFVLYLSHTLGVDITRAIEIKLEENSIKYPVEKAFGSAKKYTELG